VIHRMLSDRLYAEFSLFLEKQCGIVLGSNKQYLVKSRLGPLIRQFDCDSLEQLITAAMQPMARQIRAAVVDAMTTNETLWFRDGYPYQLLAELLLPELAKWRRPVRIWSAASSTGQEPYSIAMTFLEQQLRAPGTMPLSVTILGTDISSNALAQCKAAEYDALALARGLSAQRKRDFFEAIAGTERMRLAERVRRLVQFRQFNLLESFAPLGKFDIIFCRNVLIYFSLDVKSRILAQFADALQPGGYLVLGASESLTCLSDRFEMIHCHPGILYRLKPRA